MPTGSFHPITQTTHQSPTQYTIPLTSMAAPTRELEEASVHGIPPERRDAPLAIIENNSGPVEESSFLTSASNLHIANNQSAPTVTLPGEEPDSHNLPSPFVFKPPVASTSARKKFSFRLKSSHSRGDQKANRHVPAWREFPPESEVRFMLIEGSPLALTWDISKQ